ncbi:DUF5753 domain-containing protein [Saccharothrix syringae]|uniref:DUF5753 domain-containing protein n=1 Tax=Saccharothrix syringae TaxID=103733 RepID=A0A5Q0H2E7_SACSY|nr:DUF5753 domain-containing protein [Saccharothrix syringae]QFZ20427.1 hypothetical protein EKG83_26100 [Saccharothrix syringae]
MLNEGGSAQRRELGRELRRARLASQVTVKQLLSVMGWTDGMLHHLERGRRGTNPLDVARLLGACHSDLPTHARVHHLLQEPAADHVVRAHPALAPDDLAMLAAHEDIATTITIYSRLRIPDLVQTEDYARAVLAHLPDAARRVDLRMARQQRLLDRTPAPTVTVYLHEAALGRAALGSLGDDTIAHGQLLALAPRHDDHPWRIRLVPDIPEAPPWAWTLMPWSWTLMTFPEPIRTLTYSETPTATVFTEGDEHVYPPQLDLLDRIALSRTATTTRLRLLAEELHAPEPTTGATATPSTTPSPDRPEAP